MIDLGQLLRQTREAKELSLADVEAQTRIRQRYLAALESDDWNQLPNPVVARGFLTTYARFLGLEVDTLQSQLDKEIPRPGPVSIAAPASTTPPYRAVPLDIFDQRPNRTGWWRWLLRLAVVLLVAAAVVFLVIRFGLPFLGDARGIAGSLLPATPTLPPVGTPPETPLIILGVTNTPTPEPTPTPRPREGTTPAPTATAPAHTATPTPPNQIVLQLDVLQRAWVRVMADGQVLEEGTLSPGDAKEYVATSDIQFRTGNAGGVKVTLNGEEQTELGGPGDIIDLGWTLANGVLTLQTPAPGTPVTGTPPAETGAGTTPTVEAAVTETPQDATPTDTPTAAP